MTTRQLIAGTLALGALYWGALLYPLGLDRGGSTLSALPTYPCAVAVLAAIAGQRRGVVLRLSYLSAALLPVAQLALFHQYLLFTDLTFGSGDTGPGSGDQAGRMALVTLAIATAQVATMAALTWAVYRLITPRDRRSR